MVKRNISVSANKTSRIKDQREDKDYVGDEDNDGFEDDLDDTDTPWEDDEDDMDDEDLDEMDLGDDDDDADLEDDEDDDMEDDDGEDDGVMDLGDDEDDDDMNEEEDDEDDENDEDDEDEDEDVNENKKKGVSLVDFHEEVSDLGDKSALLLKKLDDKTVSPELAKEMLSTLVGYLGGAMDLYADLEKYAAKSDYEGKDLTAYPYKS